MSEGLVKVGVSEQVALVTLNRPEALNSLSQALRAQLVAALTTLGADPEVRVIVLTGAGRAFCAGLDLKELAAAGDEVANQGVIGQELLDALSGLEIPVIAAVNGFAMTGGFELALCCDIIIASDQAVFADTHAKVGIVPAWGISQKLPRIIGPMRAKELSLTGNRLEAQRACEWGLVNRVVPAEALLGESLALAADMVAADAGAQVKILGLINRGWEAPIAAGLAEEQAESLAAFEVFTSGG